jgi:hypothetical protein
MSGRLNKWLDTLSLRILIALIVVMVGLIVGVSILDWYIARWLPLPAWAGVTTAAILARPIYKAVKR